MNYQILSSDDAESLAEVVNLAIVDGWVPLGGPLAVGKELAQAMTDDRANETHWPELQPKK